eukprot:2403958-Rhodomonas_salina.1
MADSANLHHTPHDESEFSLNYERVSGKVTTNLDAALDKTLQRLSTSQYEDNLPLPPPFRTQPFHQHLHHPPLEQNAVMSRRLVKVLRGEEVVEVAASALRHNDLVLPQDDDEDDSAEILDDARDVGFRHRHHPPPPPLPPPQAHPPHYHRGDRIRAGGAYQDLHPPVSRILRDEENLRLEAPTQSRRQWPSNHGHPEPEQRRSAPRNLTATPPQLERESGPAHLHPYPHWHWHSPPPPHHQT